MHSAYLWDESDQVAIAEFLRAGDTGAYTQTVRDWESELAQWLGWGEAVATSSGTSALIVALTVAGIGEGSVVAMPSLTFCATAQAVLAVGATPLLVDVDPDELVLTPESLLRGLDGARCDAVIAVHLFGNLAPVAALQRTCESLGARLIEDAAQAFGSRFGTPIADDRRLVAYSFCSNKQLAVGEGGAVVCGTAADASLAREACHCGLKNDAGRWLAGRKSANHLFSGVQAALARSILARVDGWNAVRRAVAEEIGKALRPLSHLRLPRAAGDCFVVPHRVVIRFSENERRREKAWRRARERGVPLAPLYPPVHQHPLPCRRAASLETTEAFARDHLALDLYPRDAAAQTERALEVLLDD